MGESGLGSSKLPWFRAEDLLDVSITEAVICDSLLSFTSSTIITVSVLIVLMVSPDLSAYPIDVIIRKREVNSNTLELNIKQV
tara:strand:+ start:47 stop:295 length:249 start_codon:yes stop_codon:yes gene_type:complete